MDGRRKTLHSSIASEIYRLCFCACEPQLQIYLYLLRCKSQHKFTHRRTFHHASAFPALSPFPTLSWVFSLESNDIDAFTLQAVFSGSTNLCLFLLSRTYVHKFYGTLIPPKSQSQFDWRWAMHSGVSRGGLIDTQPTHNVLVSFSQENQERS